MRAQKHHQEFPDNYVANSLHWANKYIPEQTQSCFWYHFHSSKSRIILPSTSEYEGKMKSSPPTQRETLDKQPLGRDPDRGWCHPHTTSKTKKTIFVRSPWLQGHQRQHRARWKVLGLAYNRRGTRDKRSLGRDTDRSWCHRHTTNIIKLFWSQSLAPWASAAANWQMKSSSPSTQPMWNSRQEAVG